MIAVVLSAGVVATVVVSRRVAASSRRTVAHGLISTESAGFFGDPRVRKEFGRHGLDVRVATAARDPDFAPFVQDPYSVMRDLHGMGRRNAMGVEQALDQILSDLEDEHRF